MTIWPAWQTLHDSKKMRFKKPKNLSITLLAASIHV
jgi:hypothetical protein